MSDMMGARTWLKNTADTLEASLRNIGKDLSASRGAADNVSGFLGDIEGALLYSLARNCTGRGVIVEVGSWKGRSTIFLGKGSKAGKGVRIYAIDPHAGTYAHEKYGVAATFDEFSRNIEKAQVDDVLVPIIKTSEEAAKNFLEVCELIFVDGCHEFDCVKRDFELWYPKLLDGGVIAFHDTLDHLGPRTFVKDSLFKSKHFKNVRFVRSIAYGEKVGKSNVADRLKNRWSLLLNDLYKLLTWIPRRQYRGDNRR